MRSLRDPNRKPTHPGAIIREDILPELGITQAQLANHLGVSRLRVSDILHGKRGVTAEMAVRISEAIGGTPESWLRMQEALDLWEARQKFVNNPEEAAKYSWDKGDRDANNIAQQGAYNPLKPYYSRAMPGGDDTVLNSFKSQYGIKTPVGSTRFK